MATTNQCASDERRFEHEIWPQTASTSEDTPDSHSETVCQLRNQQSLVASGLAESDSDEDISSLVNQMLLLALSISSHLFAVFVH